MKSILIIVLCIISLSVADDFLCQIFNEGAQSFEYYCKNYTAAMPENCSHEKLASFNAFNSRESIEVKRVKLGGCGEKTVAHIVGTFKSLRILDISYSGYESLEWFNVGHQQLESFNVSHNMISEIPYQFFVQKFPKLTEVDFSYNNLEGVFSFRLNGASNLKCVHLSHNRIDGVGFNFEDLTDLEYVDLSDNQIDSSSDGFQCNIKLKMLNVKNNPIYYLNCDDFLRASAVSVLISLGKCAFYQY